MKNNFTFNRIPPFFIKDFLVLALVAVFSGCSTRLSVNIDKNSLCDINLSVNNSKDLISTFSELMGAPKDSVFDTENIKFSLEASGFENISIKSHSLSQMDITGTIDLSKTEKEDFVFFEKNNLKININPSSLVEKIQDIPDMTDMMELLMAPIYTEEDLTYEEYLEFFAAVYGNSVTEEFKNSNLRIDIDLPDKITKSEVSPDSIGKLQIRENSATILIPLYELLCNKKNSSYCISF